MLASHAQHLNHATGMFSNTRFLPQRQQQRITYTYVLHRYQANIYLQIFRYATVLHYLICFQYTHALVKANSAAQLHR